MCVPEENEFSVVFSQREEQLQYIQHLLASANAVASSKPFVHCANKAILRRLSLKEIETLETNCRCQASNWSQICLLVADNEQELDYSQTLRKLVSDSRFDGIVVLDLRNPSVYEDEDRPKTEWDRLPAGLHSNFLVADSIFHLRSCRVYRNSLITNTMVGPNATILECGHISIGTKDASSYGRLSISVGPESGGGRILNVNSEDTMISVCRQLKNGPSNAPALNSAAVSINVFCGGSLCRNTSTVENVFLHEGAYIEGASSVSRATLYPNASIKGSCSVSDALIQWYSSIIDNSTASGVFLMESAQIGPNSVVTSTVLGPDVHVSTGEVHASLLGPNTNAHHQSLMIGILWPLGRGNVGYGANVGSNHTGRLPDQEASVGEGVFWGLSNVIKFPIDLSFAPYSIIAAGTTLPPQRICMPFSLVMSGKDNNEIIPGWVLQSSPYTLVRSEKKFRTRQKAKRHRHYTGWKIFRPEIMAMCRYARASLLNKEEVDGFGVCHLSERARDVGIKAYTECLERYALHGLLHWIMLITDSNRLSIEEDRIKCEMTTIGDIGFQFDEDPLQTVKWPTFPWETKGGNEWNFQKMLLHEFYPMDENASLWLENCLVKLVNFEKDMAHRIRKSKQRDDNRGVKTIPGYAKAHLAADKDAVIIEADADAAHIDSVVADILTSSVTRSRL